VLSGSARVAIDDEVVELAQWDAVRIPSGSVRGMEAGEGGTEILAFGAPNTDNKDVEMQPGWWPEGG
jgi:quercetin dioxygenase-like cupin family protein